MKKDDDPSVNYGYVIATCPLSQSGWVGFNPGQLIVQTGSMLCFSSQQALQPQQSDVGERSNLQLR